jgi:hypothetical protein
VTSPPGPAIDSEVPALTSRLRVVTGPIEPGSRSSLAAGVTPADDASPVPPGLRGNPV